LRDTSLAARVSASDFQNIALMTYYSICRRSPAYFRDICVLVVCVVFRSRLRSVVPRSRTARCGLFSGTRHIACSYRGTSDWNTLPSHLMNRCISREQFKSGLKTWVCV